MNQTHSVSASLRRAVIPLLIAFAIVIATVLVSGSSLIRIEDVYVNRILAGTYGTPDWRVQEMNPALAQVLALLYRLTSAINWYGILLLLLLAASASAAIGFSSRTQGGLIPAALVVSPLLLMLTNSLLSTVVCAACASAGALSIVDSIDQKKQGRGRLIVGIILFLFAAMLSMQWALIISAGTLLCCLPLVRGENRWRGYLIGIPLMAVLVSALFGYTTLMYNSPELSSYRSNYALYERLQHSSLKDESDALLAEYGISAYSEEHEDHDHDEDGVADGEDHQHEDDEVIPPNSFDTVGWSINDAAMFFTRYGADARLTDPQTLKQLEGEANFISSDMSRLLKELFATLKKPQFLLLIALMIACAIAVVITSHRRWFAVSLACIFAFGGHIVALLCYYNAFAQIAPFYLAGLFILLHLFDGEAAKAWYHKAIGNRAFRVVVICAVLLVFAAGMGGLFYYTAKTPANASASTVEAIEFIKPYIAEHPEMLFTGDNPNDRYKPSTLEVPLMGEDQSLLAGSYDLYSPRAEALMRQFEMENPLPDSVNNDAVGYVSMSFSEPLAFRLASAYNLYLKEPVELIGQSDYSEKIYRLEAYTEEELQEQLDALRTEEEQAALWAEALEELQPLLEEEQETEEEAEPTASPEASATPSPNA